uniref:Ctr_146_T conopeptide n=1 Tax=Conus tribblei TaxID=101761 RepID=A0A0C9SFK9_CONTD
MARRLGILIVTLGLLLHWSQAGHEHYCDPRAPAAPPQGICGPAVVEKVVRACRIHRRKRRSERLTVNLLKKRGSIASLLKIRARAKTDLTKGLICECCINQCSLEEYQQYCSV